MRYLRVLLLHWQEAFVYRGRSFVWFLVALINPGILLLFWYGTISHGTTSISWSLTSVSSYYLLLSIAAAFLQVHIEEHVAIDEIQEGGLSANLLKPFPYLYLKFCVELPWRVIQGVFGVMAFLVFWHVVGIRVALVADPLRIFLAVLVIMLAFAVSFLFKMLVGLSALWTTDFRGLSEMLDVVGLVFAGFNLPIEFYPRALYDFANATPFPYMIYYPVLAVSGRLGVGDFLTVLGHQVFWIAVFGIAYRFVWSNGIRRYTGVGQ